LNNTYFKQKKPMKQFKQKKPMKQSKQLGPTIDTAPKSVRIHRFARTPKNGDVVKVYSLRTQDLLTYAIIKAVMVDVFYGAVKEYDRKITHTEMVVVEKTDRHYDTLECQFFLSESRVKFI